MASKNEDTITKINFSPVHKKLLYITLILYGWAFSICASIRYGFLVDAFSSREVPGKVYGAMEGSIFIGYAVTFFSGGVERALKKVNSQFLLAGIVFGFALTSLLTGVVYLIKDNTTVIVLSVILRVTQGTLSYSGSLVSVDYLSAQMPEQFDAVNGLLNMGYFTGHGIAESVGCLIYDRFGYVGPFIFSSSLGFFTFIVIMMVIPRSPSYLSTQDELDRECELEGAMKLDSYATNVTKLIFIPLTATMIININYGVLQVMVTPFLQNEFGKSISYGGGVLTFVSVGMAVGSISAGMLLQKKILNPFTVMAIGSLCVVTGLLLTFPPDSLPGLHNLAPITAIPGVFLAGIGDPLVSISSLRALYNLQLQKTGILMPKTATLITGIWLLAYAAFYYSGSTLAGVLTDYLTYSEVASILAGFSMLAVLISGFCRATLKDKADKSFADESTSLLG
ncbi:MFS-type transporter SLC18B1-like [Bolinopsis microptera]|uniref:MFS-type transporter SLC18B1-like n=1 Tax=Bolinopsis microptera TaxID=2820187 RepID=UPI003079AA53